MPREIELKLAFPPAARAKVLNHPLLSKAERCGPAQALINTYFDTPAQELSTQRIALRTRKAGDTWVQTVKCAAKSSGGLASRPEWEYPYAGQFDFTPVDAPDVKACLEALCDHIVPLFTTNFQRETFALTPRQGVRILAMVDSGEVSAEGRTAPISELELELVEGEADDLLALACELAEDLPLLPYDPSKAERGYRLFRNEKQRLPRATAVEIPQDSATAFDMFREISLATLRVWAASQFGAPVSSNPEYIHQLRLSLRRLRNLIRLFSPVLTEDFRTGWTPTLALLADDLAEARDLDVLCEEILENAAKADPDQRIEPLLAMARQAAAEANVNIKARLAAAGCGVPILLFTRELLALPVPAEQPPITEVASRALRTVLKIARRRLKLAQAEPSAENLHVLRIAVKRLRHTAEVFAAQFPAKFHTRVLNELGRLQSELGSQHDLSVALPHLRKWIEADPSQREAGAFVTGWLIATNLKLERSILPRCAELLALRHWRKLR
jgi:adenylate cyclase